MANVFKWGEWFLDATGDGEVQRRTGRTRTGAKCVHTRRLFSSEMLLLRESGGSERAYESRMDFARDSAGEREQAERRLETACEKTLMFLELADESSVEEATRKVSAMPSTASFYACTSWREFQEAWKGPDNG